MVAANPFEGMVTENPYRHIRHFTTLCNTVRQEGVGISFPTHLPVNHRRGTRLRPLKLKAIGAS
jgi:ribosomal protein L19